MAGCYHRRTAGVRSLKPTVLLVATSHWFPAARFAMALAQAGCRVEAVCPSRHPLRKTNAVQRNHNYRGVLPLRSLAGAIDDAKPDLIIPADDLSTRHLHHLYRNLQGRSNAADTRALIERSFGAPESFPVVYERATFMKIAEAEGIRVPATGVVIDLKELKNWTNHAGLPVVLKADGTSGGDGVRVARTMDEAEASFRWLQSQPVVARAIKRGLVNRDYTLLWPALLRRRPAVSAQTFIAGREATSAVACWKGELLASLHFEVVHKMYSAGPATVMRLVDNADMSAAVEKMVRRLKLSGIHGFDFMLERDSENAYLIEINPRITQVGHLTLGAGRDLPAALCAALTGTAVQPAPKLTDNTLITLFPQEWMRDPSSPYLHSGYLDVPWGEPELLRACVQRARKQHSLHAQRNWQQNMATVEAPRA